MIGQADFDQAVLFIFGDIERELQLAKADPADLASLTINPGGGNFLAALGLLCYTEFGGKLRFGYPKASRNFNAFFDTLGSTYAAFRLSHNAYDIFRCGLAHEYYVKKNCTIKMLATCPGPGVGIDSSGHYFFVVESYCRDLKKAFDDLQAVLYSH